MKKLLVLFVLMFAIFACSNDCLNMVNECLNGNFSEKNNNENNQGNSNTEGPEKRPTTLQEVVDNANAGEEIDLSKHELTNYTATVNKKLTIKNGSLDNAKLSVKSEGVKLENLTGLSVSASSKLTITDSKLSDLLIGGSGEISRSVTSSAEGALAMVSVTNCKIENVSLDGFNSQLNITDTVTKIEDIVISTKAKIILEAGKYEGMKAPTVKDNGEIARVDMTKKTELVVLSIYSNPYKLEYNIGDKIDLTGLTVMGTYSTDVETFKSGGWKSEGEDTITKCEDEKDYTAECDLSKAGVSIVTITSKKNPEIKCSFHVFVKESQNTDEEKPEEKIEITDVYLKIFGTAKTTYKVGERLDLSCYQVVGKYNGFEVNLPYTSEPANGAVLETAGENIEIKFHYDGGTLMQTIKVTEPWVVTFKDGNEILYTTEVADGGKLSQLPVAPSKTGYTFGGWYKDDGTKIEAGDEVTGNITLYAKWTANTDTAYKVEHYQQNITDDEYTLAETEYKTGTTFTLTDVQPKTYEGFFKKGKNDVYIQADGSSVVTIYYDRNKITLTLDLDGGEEEKITGKYGATVNVTTPTKSGYQFTGWNPELPTTFPAESATYTAQWAKEGDYVITYKLNGGTNAYDNPASYNVETATITLADATKAGYTFGGWYTDEVCTETNKVTEIKTGSTGNLTLYAKWEIVTYIITYNNCGDGVTNTNPASYNVETDTIKLADATKAGYTFGGWYTDEACTETNKVTEITKGFTGNLTLYAKWEIVTYIITYNNCDEATNTNPANYTVEAETITLADATKAGYTFGGWYDNANLTGEKITQIAKGSTGDITLHAKWTADTYTITYNLYEGENNADNPTDYNVETSTITLFSPTKTGYTFGGWYTDEACAETNKVTEIKTGSTENITLYAKWEIVTYTITYNLYDGENNTANPRSYTVETDTIKLADATKTGYTFGGWYTDEAFANVKTQIAKGSTGAVTLYAKWTKIEEKISVELPEYTEISGLTNPRTNTDGTVTFTAPSGYSNCKWYVDGDLKGQSGNEFTLNTSDMNGGIYTVMVVVTDSNGDVYSAEYRLTISK